VIEGIAKDFDPNSHYLLRLRISHPILSILAAVYVIFLAGLVKNWAAGDTGVKKWSNALSILVLVQLAFGAATLLMLAPIVMQLGHLLVGDLIWISFVIMTASFLSRGDSTA